MKFPFSFSLKFVFRILFPGFILAVGFSPLLQTILDLLGVTQWDAAAFIISVLFFGWIFVISDMPIYMVFEGRRFWPTPIWKFLKRGEEKRLKSLWDNYKNASESGDHNKMLEISVELRKFPINKDGDHYAVYPTRLGNLLASFEKYSDRIYGMDSAFYWSRIWLTLDKHIQEDVDSQQALTDSILYSVAAVYTCGSLCILYSVLKFIEPSWIPYLPNTNTLMTLSVSCYLSGYFLYRISIHLFAQFGEIFKAIFDVHHKRVDIQDVIREIANITGNQDLLLSEEKLLYKVAWRYLHNYRIKLDESSKSYTPEQLQKIIQTQKQGSSGSLPQ